MTNPRPEIRKALVKGFRNSDKPANVKNAAEGIISVIDADGTPEAFQQAYAVFMRAAEGKPFPEMASFQTLAESFGLGHHADHQ